MTTKLLQLLGLLLSTTFGVFAAYAEGQIQLALPWPPAWEYQPATLKNNVWYLQARERDGERINQVLRMSIVDASREANKLSSDSVRGLAEELAKASGSDIRAFSNASGFYFAIGDEREHQQQIDGVLMRDAHLIYFTLQTNSAQAPSSTSILAALENARLR